MFFRCSAQIYSKVKKSSKKRGSSKKAQNETHESEDKTVNPENITVLQFISQIYRIHFPNTDLYLHIQPNNQIIKARSR